MVTKRNNPEKSDKSIICTEAYKYAKSRGISKVDMTPTALAGYYLENYSELPLDAIDHDRGLGIVAETRAVSARVLIQASIL